MPNIESGIRCYLCFINTGDYNDIFSDEGMQLNMKTILLQHYGFLERISNENSTKLCACCWQVTKEFHMYFTKIKTVWEQESHNLKEIKIEKDIDPNEMFFNISNVFDSVKLEHSVQSSDNCPEANIGEESNLSFVSKSESIELDEPPIKSKRKRSKRKTTKKRKPKATKINIKTRTIEEQTERKLKLEFEDQQIRDYFTMNCDVCGDHFNTFLDIQNHFKEKHQIVGYLACCGKRLKRRGAVLDHISRHVNPDLFKCAECDKLFADAFSLKNHKDNHLPIEQRPFKCNQCSNAFAKKYMLSQHLRQAHSVGDGHFTCDDCGKSYPKKSRLKAHIKHVHEMAFDGICDICARVFKNKGNLKAHKLQHQQIDMPKVQCSICGSWLKNERSLRMHIDRHNSTQVKCTHCEKIAPNKPALSQHIKNVHSGSKHICGFCDKTLKSAISLKEHMALHTGEDLYTCPYCPKTFKSNANMHSHRKKGHPMEFKAERERRSKP